MRIVATLAGMASLFLAAPALAADVIYTFNTTGNSSVNGGYGNAFNFTSGSLTMKVTGWQANLSNNDITKAYVGAYGTGLGVTGLGDSNGGSYYHQIDNVNGYVDFVMLEFDRAVSLTGVSLYSYTMGYSSSKDNDLAYYNAGALNSNLTLYDNVPSVWTEVGGTGGNGYVPIGATGVSTKWLVGAALISDRDDGFKIASIKVTELVGAVPEPATWAMMLLGFAGVGGALRVRRRKAEAITAH
jgi:hypothetical protein